MLSDSSRDVAKQAKRKYDARDLGRGVMTGKEGERDSTASSLPQLPRDFVPIFTISSNYCLGAWNRLILCRIALCRYRLLESFGDSIASLIDGYKVARETGVWFPITVPQCRSTQYRPSLNRNLKLSYRLKPSFSQSILSTTYIRFKGSCTYLVIEVKSNKMF